MKNILLVWMLACVLAACSAPPTAAPTLPPPTATPLPPTSTPLPPTATSAPPTATVASPTELPTSEVTPALATMPLPHLSAGQPLTITLLKMIDLQVGWGVGQAAADPNDHILQTTDGGLTWRDVSPSEPVTGMPETSRAAVAYFLTPQIAWVTYFDRRPGIPPLATVWRTTDGGRTWAVSAPLAFGENAPALYQPSDLEFVDGQTGWLLAHLDAGMSHDYVAIFTTQDGGATWKQVIDQLNENLPMACYKNGLGVVDAHTAWVSGDCGGVQAGLYFYQTTDGGTTWSLVEVPAPAEAPGAFTGDTLACGAGAPFQVADVWRMTVTCNDFNTLEAKRWLYTTADGQTWTAQGLPLPYGTLEFLDAQQGWLLGTAEASGAGGSRFYTTHDGGQTWQMTKSVAWLGRFQFLDTQHGFAIAQANEAVALMKTTDGGATWAEVKPQTGEE